MEEGSNWGVHTLVLGVALVFVAACGSGGSNDTDGAGNGAGGTTGTPGSAAWAGGRDEFPAPPGNPKLFYFGESMDLRGNTSLANGGALQVFKNGGSIGPAGDALQATAGAQPTFMAGPRASLTYDGGDFLQTEAFGATLPQPNTIAMLIGQDTGAGTSAFCDGVTGATNRHLIYDNGFMNMSAGSFAGAARGTTRARYNLLVATVNDTSSTMRLNKVAVPGLPGLAVGTQALGGFTLGAAADGSLGMVGRFVTALVWTGAGQPTAQEIETWFDQVYNVGWPKPNLTAITLGSLPASPDLPIVGGDRVAFFGDSITAPIWTWHLVTGGLVDRLQALVRTPLDIVTAGVGGNTIADLDARVQADILDLNPQPQVVIIEVGVNDLDATAGGGTPLDAFMASGRSVLTKLIAGIPGVRIGWVNILCSGEQYPDPRNFAVNQYNAAIETMCHEFGATYIDVRSLQQAYEAANNTPAPGAASGLLTPDGRHTGVFSQSGGALLMGDAAMSKIAVTP